MSESAGGDIGSGAAGPEMGPAASAGVPGAPSSNAPAEAGHGLMASAPTEAGSSPVWAPGLSPSPAELTYTSPDAAFAAGYHTGELPGWEADLINERINIVAYGIAHGAGEQDRFRFIEQVDREYEVMATIVDSLDPAKGDMLFIEGMDHDGSGVPNVGIMGTPEESRAYLEERRADRSLEALHYGVGLAQLKGLRVAYADVHKATTEIFRQEVGEPSQHAGLYAAIREEQAANTVKDVAALWVHSLAPDVKPTYALAWGASHYGEESNIYPDIPDTPGLAAAFQRAGLQVKTEMMPTAMRDRQIKYVAELLHWLPAFPGAPGQLRTEAQGRPIEPSQLMGVPPPLPPSGTP